MSNKTALLALPMHVSGRYNGSSQRRSLTDLLNSAVPLGGRRRQRHPKSMPAPRFPEKRYRHWWPALSDAGIAVCPLGGTHNSGAAPCPAGTTSPRQASVRAAPTALIGALKRPGTTGRAGTPPPPPPPTPPPPPARCDDHFRRQV